MLRGDFKISYRSYYKSPKRTRTRTPLNSELQKLQEELQDLQTRSIPRQNTNFAELDQFFTNKFILIGGSILLGILIGYVIFNNRRSRC